MRTPPFSVRKRPFTTSVSTTSYSPGAFVGRRRRAMASFAKGLIFCDGSGFMRPPGAGASSGRSYSPGPGRTSSSDDEEGASPKPKVGTCFLSPSCSDRGVLRERGDSFRGVSGKRRGCTRVSLPSFISTVDHARTPLTRRPRTFSPFKTCECRSSPSFVETGGFCSAGLCHVKICLSARGSTQASLASSWTGGLFRGTRGVRALGILL
mmetsp:Transcript_17405/g.49679  ORF Transcript_17405/g.49679 Transcript_17405/m.49679 type:complete len:209 (+) Transcript_17405:1624-2250(+)